MLQRHSPHDSTFIPIDLTAAVTSEMGLTTSVFESWQDLYREYTELQKNQRNICIVKGGINNRKIVLDGIMAVKDGYNNGTIEADYVLQYTGENCGLIIARKEFWAGKGRYPRVFTSETQKNQQINKTCLHPNAQINDFYNAVAGFALKM